MASAAVQKLPLFSLTAMVVGSMVGAATGPFGAIIAWTIAATGM